MEPCRTYYLIGWARRTIQAISANAKPQNLYTDEEVSNSTAYPAEIRDTVHEKLNIRRKIRYRRNRTKGTGDEEQGGLETSSAGTSEEPVDEGRAPVVSPRAAEEEEEEEEEQPQMSILATIVCLVRALPLVTAY